MSLSLNGLADRAGSRVQVRDKKATERIRKLRKNALAQARRDIIKEIGKLPLPKLREIQEQYVKTKP